MPKPIERLLLLFCDFFMIVAAFFVLILFRREIGLFASFQLKELFQMATLTFFYWLFIFVFFGLYRSWYAQSRLDEFVTIIKTISIGCFFVFILTIEPTHDLKSPLTLGRSSVFTYWGAMVVLVTVGRMLLRTFQRKLLENGIGVRKTLILGWNDKARHLCDELHKFPAMGYEVIGFVDAKNAAASTSYHGVRVLGGIRNIGRFITRYQVEEVVISLESSLPGQVMEAISACDNYNVKLKIVPELYHVVIGQARVTELYGLPLIEILPEMMPAWERKTKRLIDVVVSLVFLLTLAPLFLLVSILIKLTSSGDVFYQQERVGKDGKDFIIYKFRSMYEDAEKHTGPVWATKVDPRVTPFGRFLRKSRVDEFPQVLNVLSGHMSLVGPRPERPFFVDKLKQEVPLYARRLKIKPGITGWAQVKGDYDTSIEAVKHKLEFDLYYLENMSLRMDLKIMLATVITMIGGKGQ